MVIGLVGMYDYLSFFNVAAFRSQILNSKNLYVVIGVTIYFYVVGCLFTLPGTGLIRAR